jgi:DNA-binding NarL/FixJ family response regulator
VPKVLILTTFDVDDYAYEELAAGASGFLLKDTPPEQLVEAARSVAAGESLLAPPSPGASSSTSFQAGPRASSRRMGWMS